MFKNFITTFSKMPIENSAEILAYTQNLINTKIRMLKLAHRGSQRLRTRNKPCELQKY